MTTVLTPKLRPLDEQVKAALSDKGQRASAIAATVLGYPYWRCEECARVCEIREVLRGLECLGLARQAGGWWRAV